MSCLLVTIFSSAIKKAVDDASHGDYGSAIECLLNAISQIKQSKVLFKLKFVNETVF